MIRQSARRDNPATFTYVERTTGDRPSWQFALPYWPIFAAIPKQHDAFALAMIRLVREAVEQNKTKPVPFYHNTPKCLREMEEIIVAAHTSISIHLVPPTYRHWAANIKRMVDHPESEQIGGIVADAMRQTYDLGADREKLITTFMLIYGG